jgi:uncharacterized membrane protein YphA (DoxX/SURF4 family)
VLEYDWLIAVVMGAVFILLGLASVFWGRSEEKSYYETISSRADVREYVERSPERPEPGGLKAGGWIAIAVGLLLLVFGVLFLR